MLRTTAGQSMLRTTAGQSMLRTTAGQRRQKRRCGDAEGNSLPEPGGSERGEEGRPSLFESFRVACRSAA
ncbi:MAG: hypothetical protein ACYTG0_24135 [Planctomycetota bacterium]|jgi:hypothetical protein